jgi:hypothetical protein
MQTTGETFILPAKACVGTKSALSYRIDTGLLEKGKIPTCTEKIKKRMISSGELHFL